MKNLLCARRRILEIVLFISLLLSLPLSLAYTNDIRKLAHNLQTDNEYETVDNIHYWLWTNINHKPYWYPRGIETTWKEKEGDCTDKAQLAVKMLKYLGYTKHEVYTVHGLTNEGLHDWYLVKINNKFYNPDEQYFKFHVRMGRGVW